MTFIAGVFAGWLALFLFKLGMSIFNQYMAHRDEE
jgi:hypothetical protein